MVRTKQRGAFTNFRTSSGSMGANYTTISGIEYIGYIDLTAPDFPKVGEQVDFTFSPAPTILSHSPRITSNKPRFTKYRKQNPMKLNQRNLGKLGFKGSHPMCSPTSLDLHWKKFKNKVVFADGIANRIGIFHLSPSEEKEFKANKLSLVPPGCCSPTRRNIKEDAIIIYEGEPKSTKHFLKLIEEQLSQ